MNSHSGLTPAIQARFRFEQRVTNRWLESTVEVFDIWLGRRALLRTLRPPTGSGEESAMMESALLGWAEDSTKSAFFYPTILDFGRTTFRDNRVVYLVCEMPEGQRLADRLRERGPMAPDEALQVVAHILSMLRSGWQEEQRPHLSLSPHTVLLQKNTAYGGVRLDAWGMLEPARSLWPALAQRGDSEALWLAPEQREGADWGPRTDFWAVGQLLYFMLTGLEPTPFGAVPVYGPLQALVESFTAADPAKRPASHDDAIAQVQAALPKVSGAHLVVSSPRQMVRVAPVLAATLLVSLAVGTGITMGGKHLLGGGAQTPKTAMNTLIFAPLKCKPEGARVYEGSVLLGVCPLKIPFDSPSASARVLRIEATGFESIEVKVDPAHPAPVVALHPTPAQADAPEPAPHP